jgi:prepilin-type N-terminal cleavage/methylation domain-containing protein
MKTERGFTIIEVMIALVVLGLGLLGVAVMQTKAVQGNVLGKRVTEGSALGEAWMEWLMKQSYDKVAALDTNADDLVATLRTLNPDTLLTDLQTWGLGTFTGDEVPPLEGAGCAVVKLRVTASMPMEHLTTVEIETQLPIRNVESQSMYADGAVQKPMLLRFMMSPHM